MKGDTDQKIGTMQKIQNNYYMVKNRSGVWHIQTAGVNSNLDHFNGKTVKVTIEEE